MSATRAQTGPPRRPARSRGPTACRRGRWSGSPQDGHREALEGPGQHHVQVARRRGRRARGARSGRSRGALPVPRRDVCEVQEGRPRPVDRGRHRDRCWLRRRAPHTRYRGGRHRDLRRLARLPAQPASAGSRASASSSATPTLASHARTPSACRPPAGSAASSTSSATFAPCCPPSAIGRWRPGRCSPSSASRTPPPRGRPTGLPSTRWTCCRPARVRSSRGPRPTPWPTSTSPRSTAGAYAATTFRSAWAVR